MQNQLIRSTYCKVLAFRHLTHTGKQQNETSLRHLTKCGIIVMLGMLFCLGTGAAVHAATPGKSDQTPTQLLQKSVHAMRLLKSFSFAMNIAATTTETGTIDNRHPSSIAIKAIGVWVQPDRTEMRLSIHPGSSLQVPTTIEIIAGQKLYTQDQKGLWYVMNKPSSGDLSNPFAGLNMLISNSNPSTVTNKVKDNGTVVLNGIRVRHLTLTIGEQKQQDLSNQLTKSSQPEIVKNAVADVWIDEATSYIQRFQLQFKQVTLAGTPSSSAKDTTITVTTDYSKFNDDSLKVIVPENALPLPEADITKAAK